MAFQIIVCIKCVPDPEEYNKIKIHPVTKTLIRDGVQNVINPCDKHAIELAVSLKEQYGGNVIIVTMAPQNATIVLREALSYGADEAYLLSDRKYAGADTLATSYSLAELIKKIGIPDIIITGNESADGATSHVPSQLAEWLRIPHVSNVSSAIIENDMMRLQKETEEYLYEYETTFPILVAVNKNLNSVRYLNMKQIISSKNKKIEIVTAADLSDLDETQIGLSGSPTKSGELIGIDNDRDTIEIVGNPEEITSQLITLIRPYMSETGVK